MLYSTSVGLDVHARSIKAAAFTPETGEIREAAFAYDIESLVTWIKDLPQPVQCVYESGPTGFHLLRHLHKANIACSLGAVSKMLRPSGDKIKDDRRDALFLARMLAVGNIVEVYVPGIEYEAARDLARLREDIRIELSRAKQLLSKFLLRKGIVYDRGKVAWTKRHRFWLEGLVMETPVEQTVLIEYLSSVEQAERKRERIDTEIARVAKENHFKELVSRFSMIRGIGIYAALAITVEIGDFSRFKSAGAFCSYLGLVPSLSQSGESLSKGCITKTGNSHVRKLLVESAWLHRRQYRPSFVDYPDDVCPHIIKKAKDANAYLHKRTLHLANRKIHPCKANVAIARAVAGTLWSLAIAEREQ